MYDKKRSDIKSNPVSIGLLLSEMGMLYCNYCKVWMA